MRAFHWGMISLFILVGTVDVIMGRYLESVISFGFAVVFYSVFIYVSTIGQQTTASCAAAQGVLIHKPLLTPHRLEHEGAQWVLRNLRTGLAVPVDEGDILYLAAPEMLSSGPTMEDTCS